MLKTYLGIIARGQGRARPLTQDEARQAMQIILQGDVAPEVLGAFLMVLRFRGETAPEIAGFTAALRAFAPAPAQDFDLDWPCYAAGRTRGAPLFLLAAKLVAQAGFRVALHGWNSHQRGAANIRDALEPLEIPVSTPTAPITYMPLETLSPRAFDLLNLRQVLGLRSCINTVLRMWNPTQARASVQGVFHPSYRSLQARAAEALGQTDLTIIKGGGGEFERHPGKQIEVFGLRGGTHHKTAAQPLVDETRRLHETSATVDAPALWHGTAQDDFAQATVIGTAGLALWTVGATDSIAQAEQLASELWNNRHNPQRRCA